MKVPNIHIVLLLIMIGVSGCSNTYLKPDSPEHTTLLMKNYIDNHDYQSFDALFSDGRKGSISKNDFAILQEISTTTAGYRRYELVTFDNGQMVLVRLTPPNEENEIEIEDVLIVPDDMKELFN